MTQVVLEVIEGNDKAVKLYEGLGFERTSRVECFKGASPVLKSHAATFQTTSIAEAHTVGEAFREWRPTWQNDTPAMALMAEDINATIALLEGMPVGYGMVQKSNGLISQIAVDLIHRRKGIARAMLSHWAETHDLKNMAILNIPDTDKASTAFFHSFGWENHVNQFVMNANL